MTRYLAFMAVLSALVFGAHWMDGSFGPAPAWAHGGGKDKHGCHRDGAQRHCHITVSGEQLKLRMEIERLRKAIERMGEGRKDKAIERACRELYKQFDRENRANDHKPVYSAVRAKCWIGVKPGEAR